MLTILNFDLLAEIYHLLVLRNESHMSDAFLKTLNRSSRSIV